MMDSLRKVIGSMAGKEAKVVAPKQIFSSAVALRPSPSTMPYQLSSARWHLDTRPLTSVVLIHDLGCCSSSWSPLNEVVGRLPTQGVSCPPLNFYMPNLRNHTGGHNIPESNLQDYVDDVVKFVSGVVEPGTPIHLVGHGFGGKLALLTALAVPSKISSVTAFADDDIFGEVTAPENRIKLLQRAVGECSDLPSLNTTLSQTVKDDEERASLMFNVEAVRIPRDVTSLEASPSKKQLKLTLDCDEILKQFGAANTANTQWPTLQTVDGDKSSQDEVAAQLSKDTAKIRCHIIKSAIPGSTAVNKGRLEAYFTDTKVTEVMQGLKGGFMSRKDAKVIAPVCLSTIGCTEARDGNQE